MIIGFGSTEETQRKNTEEWIRNTIKKIYNEQKTDEYFASFTEEMISEFKKQFKVYQEKIKEEYEVNDKGGNRPERYYHISYGVEIAYTVSALFVRINFWHINSRHAFSPDGIALMQYPETFTILSEEL